MMLHFEREREARLERSDNRAERAMCERGNGTGGNFSPQQRRSMQWQAAYDARIRAAWERLFREQEHGI